MSTRDMVQRVEDIFRSNIKVREAHIACSKHLRERQFSNNDQIQTDVLSWLLNQGAIFYRQNIEKFVERSENACSDWEIM